QPGAGSGHDHHRRGGDTTARHDGADGADDAPRAHSRRHRDDLTRGERGPRQRPRGFGVRRHLPPPRRARAAGRSAHRRRRGRRDRRARALAAGRADLHQQRPEPSALRRDRARGRHRRAAAPAHRGGARQRFLARDGSSPEGCRTPTVLRQPATVALMKTNAARILDRMGIAYEVREYEVDEDDLSAPTVARKVGLEPAQVFKTLVTRGESKGICLAVVAADAELDLKALAKAFGDKKSALVALKEVQPLTGYIRGGVTALGTKKRYPV